jgi:hypothetical protein
MGQCFLFKELQLAAFRLPAPVNIFKFCSTLKKVAERVAFITTTLNSHSPSPIRFFLQYNKFRLSFSYKANLEFKLSIKLCHLQSFSHK